MLSIFCAGAATALMITALVAGRYGLAAVNAALVAVNVFLASDLIWPAQRHSATAHGVGGPEATEVAKNASAAVRPSAAPLRGNSE